MPRCNPLGSLGRWHQVGQPLGVPGQPYGRGRRMTELMVNGGHLLVNDT